MIRSGFEKAGWVRGVGLWRKQDDLPIKSGRLIEHESASRQHIWETHCIRQFERICTYFLSFIIEVFCFPKDQIHTKQVALLDDVSQGYVKISCENALLIMSCLYVNTWLGAGQIVPTELYLCEVQTRFGVHCFSSCPVHAFITLCLTLLYRDTFNLVPGSIGRHDQWVTLVHLCTDYSAINNLFNLLLQRCQRYRQFK